MINCILAFILGLVVCYLVLTASANFLVKAMASDGSLVNITRDKKKGTFKVRGDADKMIEAYNRAKQFTPGAIKYVDNK